MKKEPKLSIYVYDQSSQSTNIFTDSLSNFYNLKFSSNEKDIFEEVKLNHYDLIILNICGDFPSSLEILSWLKLTIPYTPVIITSDTEDVEAVVKFIKLGAYDFIINPVSSAKLRHIVRQAIENRSLRNEIDYLRRGQDVIYDFDKIIAFSPIMKDIIYTLKKFAKTDSTILMTGDTGTGKSFLAGSIHFNSIRRDKPFVTINCANIPETLLESELFGHEKGAFTGADKMRVGRFEQARGGTIFLDEIGEISLSIQAKLLRVLEEKCFERVGGNKTIHSDVRVIVATNKNLEKQISENKFREDLFYRINILSVMLPPLRDRREDIEPLAYYLLDKLAAALKKGIKSFSPDCIAWMKSYEWPGNIRQLSNTIERAVILEETKIIRKKNIFITESTENRSNTRESHVHAIKKLDATEREMIIKALEESLWIQRDAAAALGISPRALNYKIKKLGITHPRWRKNA